MQTSLHDLVPPPPLNTVPDRTAGELVVRALWLSGTKHEAAAAYMGISKGQFSQQIAGQGHLSFRRMLNLPVTFWVVLCGLVLQHQGLSLLESRVAAGVGHAIAASVAALKLFERDRAA